MIISHKYQFIFIKTRKTAGTSIETYLSQYCGDLDVLTPISPAVNGHQSRNWDGYYNHIGACSVREKVGLNIWNKYYKFCVERNPWDKTLSYYHMLNFRNGGNLSLDDYFISADYCVDYLTYVEQQNQSQIIVDKVLQYESLNQELGAVFQSLGIPFSGELNVNEKSEYRTDRRSYKEVLSIEQADLISHAFASEISFFGYSY